MNDEPWKPSVDRRIPISFTLRPEIIAKLDRKAREAGKTRSRWVEELVRDAVSA
jgi:hypothetical protein